MMLKRAAKMFGIFAIIALFIAGLTENDELAIKAIFAFFVLGFIAVYFVMVYFHEQA